VATSDKAGQRRLRRVAKQCQDYGQRVQYSVFECVVDPAQWAVLRNGLIEIIDKEIERLPPRQREAFLLRYWEELDVAETAGVMGCSQGSVKTHCSRAAHALATALRAKGLEL